MRNRNGLYPSVLFVAVQLLCFSVLGQAQTAPTEKESSRYQGLHRAAHTGNLATLKQRIAEGANLEERDNNNRTALHIAVFASHDDVVRELINSGANPDSLDTQNYDVVTIAAVANDLAILDLVLDLGASPANITSPYQGTALIAAAHLGHHKVVDRLITAGAPIDHINNLGWTALIEAVILGDGGDKYVETVRLLVAAGADTAISDRSGESPLDHAKARGYSEIIKILEK